MKTYVVGGAVRDRLLGLPVVDRDHVVVGATVDDMLAAHYKPVGRDFPVFLHPTTHEEYALARTERKVASGYTGFLFHADPSVTLEADLARRDLTINAMAEDDDGRLIDPFGGRRDLALKVFRHVGPAFVEDPVRLLRVARFAARFTDFSVAPETGELLRRMTRDGEIDALVPERVWQEISRGLMEARPSRIVDVLRDAGAFERLFPELDRLFATDAGPRMLEALDTAADADAPLEVRFAVLVQAIGAVADPQEALRELDRLCKRLAVPRAARDLATIVTRERGTMTDGLDDAAAAARIGAAMERSDAFRRRDRFVEAVDAIGWTIADPIARRHFVDRMRAAVAATRTIDTATVVRAAGGDPQRIAEGLRAARSATIAAALASDARSLDPPSRR